MTPHEPSYSAFKEQITSSLFFLPAKTTKQTVHHNPTSRQIDLSNLILHNPLSSYVSRRPSLNLPKTVKNSRIPPLPNPLKNHTQS